MPEELDFTKEAVYYRNTSEKNREELGMVYDSTVFHSPNSDLTSDHDLIIFRGQHSGSPLAVRRLTARLYEQVLNWKPGVYELTDTAGWEFVVEFVSEVTHYAHGYTNAREEGTDWTQPEPSRGLMQTPARRADYRWVRPLDEPPF